MWYQVTSQVPYGLTKERIPATLTRDTWEGPWVGMPCQSGGPARLSLCPLCLRLSSCGISEIFVFNHKQHFSFSFRGHQHEPAASGRKVTLYFHCGWLVHLKCCLNCTYTLRLLSSVGNQLDFTKCSTGWTLDSMHTLAPLAGTKVQKLKCAAFCDPVFIIPFSSGKSMQFSLLRIKSSSLNLP